MTSDSNEKLAISDVLVLSKAARLNLSSQRAEIVCSELDDMLQLLDTLDALDLGEIAPTNSFDPRWERVS